MLLPMLAVHRYFSGMQNLLSASPFKLTFNAYAETPVNRERPVYRQHEAPKLTFSGHPQG